MLYYIFYKIINIYLLWYKNIFVFIIFKILKYMIKVYWNFLSLLGMYIWYFYMFYWDISLLYWNLNENIVYVSKFEYLYLKLINVFIC